MLKSEILKEINEEEIPDYNFNGLTMYIIPCGNEKESDAEKSIISFGKIEIVSEILEDRRLDLVNPDTEWYGFLFDNEWISKGVRDALPIFLSQYHFDYLVFYKKVMDKGNPRFFTVPRIFRKGVKIDKNKLTPQGFEKFRYEIFLNGWILENERN